METEREKQITKDINSEGENLKERIKKSKYNERTKNTINDRR